jgi:hypothetical protein
MEEIITTSPHDRYLKAQRDFFLELSSALWDHESLRLVLAFREEFYVQILRIASDVTDQRPHPRWTTVAFPLGRLTPEEARLAITRPAEMQGVSFDTRVLESLINELAPDQYWDALNRQHGEVEPIQLQVVCRALWRNLSERRKKISWDEIESALLAATCGNQLRGPAAIAAFVKSALENFCGDAIHKVAADARFPVELIDLGFHQFISKSGFRRFVHQDAEYTGCLPNRVVVELERHQLLHSEQRGGERLYGLAHDKLVEPIRERATVVDASRLESLWRRTLQTIAGTEHAPDVDPLIAESDAELIDDRGSALIAGRGKLPARVLALLCESGLVRPTAGGFALSNADLAAPLRRMRLGLDQAQRPLTDLVRSVFACVVATIVTVVATMISRAFLAGFRLTLTQSPDVGVFAGWFHGVVGALVWAVMISSALSRRWFIVEKRHPAPRAWLRWGLTGAAAGIIGGGFVTLALIYAQRPDSLVAAGWIVKGGTPSSAFTVTGFGYTMFLFGAAVGWACGFETARMLASPKWKEFLADPLHGTSGTFRSVRRILAHVVRETQFGMTVLLPMVAAGIVLSLLIFSVFKPPVLPTFQRIFGECLSITFGDIGLIAGLLLGVFWLEKGVDIPAQDDSQEPTGRTPD